MVLSIRGSGSHFLLIAILVPVFLIVSLVSSKTYDARKQDFAAYWQAGYMVLHGEDMYDSSLWIAERERMGTALHSESAFHYPLPFAIFFSPLALIPIQASYTLWLFFQQTVILISVILMLRLLPPQSGYTTVFALACVFLFRPSFSVIFNGQILSILLLVVVLAIDLFRDGRWFWGGLCLSLLCLKPSIGVPIIGLTCLWFLFVQSGKGIAGVATGGILLFLIGATINPNWVIDYLQIGGATFNKYVGLHPTLWGMVYKIPIGENFRIPAGIVTSVIAVGIESFLLLRVGSNLPPLAVVSTILPVGLLVAPYSWNYDQLLLVVPMVYLMTLIGERYGRFTGWVYLAGMVILSIALVILAYTLLHDVWSIVNSIVVWVLVMLFTARTRDAMMNVTI